MRGRKDRRGTGGLNAHSGGLVAARLLEALSCVPRHRLASAHAPICIHQLRAAEMGDGWGPCPDKQEICD